MTQDEPSAGQPPAEPPPPTPQPVVPPPPAVQAPPPPPQASMPPGRGYYSGPWPPEGIQPKREGLWSIIWRTATRTSVIAIFAGLAFVVGILAFFGVIAAMVAATTDDDSDPDDLELEFAYGDRDGDSKLLEIRIEGVIMGERDAPSLFDSGTVYGYEVKDQLRKAAMDDSIEGVVLHLATPGGTIYGSQAIADGVEYYQQQTGNPVLAFVAGISASGGVWAMVPADRILADHGSLTGSIGVIMGPFVYYDGIVATEGGLLGGGVTTTNGITYEYLTAGRGKDMGSPFRPLSDEERDTLQAGLDDIYASFVAHVSRHRDIPEAQIRNEMGALIYDNSSAEAFGLIDGTANLEDAYAELADMAGILGDDWRVMRIEDGGGLFGALLEGEVPPAAAEHLDALPAEGCVAPGTMLAYYGDPASLCWR